MPKLITPDGELDEAAVNRQFAESMAEPEANEPLAAAPPRRPPATPPAAVQEPAEDPKHSKARTTSSTSSTGGSSRPRARRGSKKAEPGPGPAEGTYVQPVAEFLQGLTIAGALAPIPAGPLATRLRLQAQLVEDHRGGLATAVDAAARHNAVIRKGVESLTMGSAGWVLPAVLAVAPFAALSFSLWKTPVDEEMVRAGQVFETEVRAAMMGQPDDASAAA
ncbi:MAG: hypothetical protein JWP34_5042 [Massilia sp.]|nr:hypothetical protein [Massilia sp.]